MTKPRGATRQADAELMQRVTGRSEEAFVQLMRSTAQPVDRTVFKTVRNRAIADEVVQEVYLEAWSRSHRYDPDLGSVQAWMTVLAHRRAIDRVRSEERSRRRAALCTNGVDIDMDDPAELALIAEQNAHVRLALGRLSDAQRTVLVLAYVHGHTQAEMSTMLGVPLGTVKTRVRAGLRNLRRLLPSGSSTPNNTETGRQFVMV